MIMKAKVVVVMKIAVVVVLDGAAVAETFAVVGERNVLRFVALTSTESVLCYRKSEVQRDLQFRLKVRNKPMGRKNCLINIGYSMPKFQISPRR